MEDKINYEYTDFYSIATNNDTFKHRFKTYKLVKEQTNKVCLIVYCMVLQRLCFLKIKLYEDNTKDNNYLKIYDLLIKNNHHNIELFYEYIIVDNLLFILSEYIEGNNLNEYDNKFDNKLLIKIINQTIEGLNFIHSINIIHGDIKLENIMLTKNNDIKIIDFDLSQICNNYILSKDIFGSENYIAPESFDLQIYSKKTDIWSFGISLYKLVSGKFPYIFKPNKSHHMYIRNNFKILDFKELDKFNYMYDKKILSLIKNMLNFIDENRTINVKIDL